jgi:hypothetical protein
MLQRVVREIVFNATGERRQLDVFSNADQGSGWCAPRTDSMT